MPKVLISDVIVPEIFNKYVMNRTTEKSALFRSGIIATNPELTALAQGSSTLITMPHWNDLGGDDEVLSQTTPLSTDKITSGKDIARKHFRGKAWSANELSGVLAGSDPMMAIADLVADFWVRAMQKVTISTLTGVFGSASMAKNAHDISGATGDAAKITGKTFVDAQYKLGDASDQLTAVIMHSATYAELLKQQLIAFRPEADATKFGTYMGYTVIVDDGMPVKDGVFTTYLFGAGALGYADGNPPVPTETDRDSLQGDDLLINRKHFVLHPRGIKWTETAVAGLSPTNVELATASNWERVFDPKKIRIVKFTHKIQ